MIPLVALSREPLQMIQRHVRGEQEKFACVGGYKYFYLDWNLDIWRCEAWSKPLGSVFDLDNIPDCRDHCTNCMISCYRNVSVLMHVGVAVDDARAALAAGRVGEAARLLFRPTVALSLGAVLEQGRQILRLTGKRRQVSHPVEEADAGVGAPIKAPNANPPI